VDVSALGVGRGELEGEDGGKGEGGEWRGRDSEGRWGGGDG